MLTMTTTQGMFGGCSVKPVTRGLAFFRDNPERLAAAINYLKSPPASKVSYTEPLTKPVFPKSVKKQLKRLNLVCKECGSSFQRNEKTEHDRIRKGKDGPFCNRRCAGRWSQKQQKVTGIIHGTTNGYTYYKCRCTECRRAHRDAERARLRKKNS